MTRIKEITTSKNTKMLLFASLIAAMILPFSEMEFAMAEELDEEKAKKMAKKVHRLMEKLETENDPEKIAKIQKKLDRLLSKLNAVGLYTEEQFETVKAQRASDRPQEEEISYDGNRVRKGIPCSSCDDSKSVHVRVGFDYKLWGLYGTANGYWNEINESDRNGYSQSYTGSWGADYMHTWVQYYCENCNSADVTMTPYIASKNGNLVKSYGTTSKTTTSSTIEEYYPSTLAYSNVRANDNANLVAVLNNIR